MKDTTKKLRDWAIEKIKTEYVDDIALLVAVHGHSVNNDGHGECFDYFIPATERGYQFSQTFIVDGIGHDLYPRSWKRTEATAALEEGPTMCLVNAEIVYSRSKEDEERFISIRKSLKENMANKEYMYRKALEQLDVAMNLYTSLMFHDKMYQIRMATGYITTYLAKAIAYLNGTFLDFYEREKIVAMKAVPDNFLTYNDAVLQTNSEKELKELSYNMICVVRKFVKEHKKVKASKAEYTDFTQLANWYQELSLTFRRLKHYCDEVMGERAYMEACYLQNEMGIVQKEFGLNEMDLMGYYDPKDLDKMKQHSIQLEEYLCSEIEKHGTTINKYDTVEDFLNKN